MANSNGVYQRILSKELKFSTHILNALIYLCKTKPDKNKFFKFMFYSSFPTDKVSCNCTSCENERKRMNPSNQSNELKDDVTLTT